MPPLAETVSPRRSDYGLVTPHTVDLDPGGPRHTVHCHVASGERYMQTYYNDVWLAQRKVDLRPFRRQLQAFFEHGEWSHRQPRAWIEDNQESLSHD